MNSFQSKRNVLGDWHILCDSLRHIICLYMALFSANAHHVTIILQILTILPQEKAKELQQLHHLLEQVIDFSESKENNGRVCVRRGVSEDLDDLKMKLATLPAFLTRVAQDDMTNGQMPPTVTEFSIIYWYVHLRICTTFP